MARIKELKVILKRKGIDFFLSVNLGYGNFVSDIVYFSGYNGVGALVVPKEKEPFLVVPKGELKSARKFGLKVYTSDKKKKLFEVIKEVAKRNKIKCKRIGINKEEFTLLLKDVLRARIGRFRLADLQKELYKVREQKTKKEIELIRKGCRISDEILRRCFKEFERFEREADVVAFLEYEAKKMGCKIAFPTIVASGKNSSEVHYDVASDKLKKGFCVIDFGIRYKNYCTDTSRTIYLGKPSKREIEAYELLLNVQKEAIKNVRVGLKCSKLFKEVKKNLGKYAKFFSHGLGHGFGVMVHESPSFFEDSKDVIKEDSVFTIEPGVYLKRFGIRIEDDVLATKDKIEVLTKVPKELIVIK